MILSKDTLSTWWKNPLHRFLIFLSAYYSLIFNTPIYLVYYAGDYFVIAKAMILSLLITFSFFALFSFLKIIKVILLPLFFLLGSIASYFIFSYKLLINHNAIALMAETSSDEAGGLISGFLVVWVLINLIVGFWFASSFYRHQKNHRKNRSLLSLVFLIPLFFVVYFIGTPVDNFFKFLPMPLTFFHSTAVYAKERNDMNRWFSQKKDLGKVFPGKRSDQQPIRIILIIGEAARASHFGMNGYFRKTSPQLEQKNVISYPKLSSCSTITRFSVPCLMSRATIENPDLSNEETSLISVFRSAGFRTKWISNQQPLGGSETPISIIAKEAEQILYINRTGNQEKKPVWDENLILPLHQFITQEHQKNSLSILQMIGSHWKYDSHYPASFKVFQPTCEKNTQKFCAQSEVINSYDNSIFYTDFVISKIIDEVQKENALIIYVSDHGESLGENGRYSHWVDQMHVKEQREAAFIIWASEKYKKNYPDFYKNLKINQNRVLSHDFIFHTVLDCAGVDSKVVDKSMSLCAP